MGDRVILIIDGKRYEVKGDESGFRDRTGAPFSGPPEKIRGDRVSGFRDVTGAPIQLREIEEGKE
ncbi:MAG TPA: hypothetical protein DEB73_02730 [Candidatus Magasanikbacteria bacterium]|nr:hypothetical protein [Candidatus Magasanikbacteria bacterium]HBX16424.1 hypothetical protein [Candidatus Magasanikbacteria bacterium]